MMNSVQIAGRLTRDAELKYTQGGMAVANFTVAVSRYKKGGEDTADFIRCVAFGKTAEIVAERTKKGNRVLVEGSIKTGKYEHKDGYTVYTTEINAYNVNIIDWADDKNNNDIGFTEMTPTDNDSIPF